MEKWGGFYKKCMATLLVMKEELIVLRERKKIHCGAVIIANVPGMWGQGNTAQCYEHFPAALVTGAVKLSFLTRELCCPELPTILTASLTMADNRADVQAAHICSGLVSLSGTRPLSLSNTCTRAPSQTKNCFTKSTSIQQKAPKTNSQSFYL